MKDELKLIMNRIDQLDKCIHELEATANCFYSPDDKEWNILLSSRDKIVKLRDNLWRKYSEVELKIKTIKQ